MPTHIDGLFLFVHVEVVDQAWYMGVSENGGTPKSSLLIRISIINSPFWGTTIFGNTHITSVYRSISLFFSI